MQGRKRMPVEGARMVREAVVGVRVSGVYPDGIGREVGIRVGDVIESINGNPIRDPIDYRFHIAEEEVEVALRRGETSLVLEIEKHPDEDLGVDLDDMPILRCDNKCVFCFLHQMPRGMRKTLYYQDDDYRLSFLHGAYVTLTNLSDADFQRIVEQRLSPMYISVHATHPEVRRQLLGRSESADVMARIGLLARSGIRMHAQVVLCPGLNDGAVLKQTVFDLAAFYPHVESLGVVPVGLTRYRRNLPALNPVTPDIAALCIREADEWQRRFGERFGVNFVYLGDEFYLLAGQEIPEDGHYDGFPLVENGVGMVRRFVDVFEAGFERLAALRPAPLQVTLVTGTLGERFLQGMADRLNRLEWLDARMVAVSNRFFGNGITVSGLLTGADMRDSLKGCGRKGIVVLPPNCINHEGVFLDDLTPADLSQLLGCQVVVGSYDLVETIEGLVEGREHAEPSREEGRETRHPYISPHQVV